MLDVEYWTAAALVRIRRAPRGVLSADLLDGLGAAVGYIGDRPIVLTGSGGVFAPDLDPAPEAASRLADVLSAFRAHASPVVAAINGDAIGAGYALASAARARVMSGGDICPVPGGSRFSVAAALAEGLVERACAPADLLGEALHLARSLDDRHPAVPVGG
ncbi:hypothetical protein FPZ12_018295 [Amycolatopsis acidicola]|uniref:Enoyl-CoA hydratase/isomerase family protein n=1 Tax=Amycolatopsis acidicola TaxID=2596893 RepID=A0A5N0V4N1_9PSEU|nr:hypothetical protein [Amycolatopsis acidicola]KAA9160043.1 hypothetical protein FPZ12_018295 [Amycolatopsis acidicola]